jgi:predicted amidohydrolase YtcJ
MSRHDALSADLILVNGRVLTMDAGNTVAQAVAIADGKILAVGTNQEIEALAGSRTEGIDLQGRTTLPGLADIHVHLASDAGKSSAVEVRDFYDPGIRSVGDLQDRIRRRAIQCSPDEWIIATGSPMQDFRLAEHRLPTRDELDEVAPDNPSYVSFGAHVIVANSRALHEKGVTRDTESPQGGTVVKDESGEPTGVLRERAQYFVKNRGTDVKQGELAEHVLRELERCAMRGVTTIHDIIVAPEEVQAYQQLARDGRLPVRVQMILRVIESQFSKESLLDLGFLHGFGSDYLRIGGVKMSIDGGFTGKNAAFSEPLSYHGDENPGLIRIAQDELDETVWRYHEMGMRCCVHAIGDIALDMILEAYEKALTRLPRADHRHRVEHFGNWMFTPERVARARKLGLIPVPNPSIYYFLGRQVVETLGPKRTEHAFPHRTQLEAGFPLSFGSDAPGYWPVDPFRDLGAAVARVTYDGLALSPEEAISLEQALRAQTATAAYLGFQEHRLGTLEPGKLADLAVLAEDPFHFEPDRFRELPFDLTITGGKVVYSR